MSLLLTLGGVTMPDATGLETHISTQLEDDISHVPGRVVLIDPDHFTNDDPRNIARTGSSCDIQAGSVTLGTFDNGSTCFDMLAGGEMTILPDVAWPTEAWTIFGVMRPRTPASGSSSYSLGYSRTGWQSGDVMPWVGLNAGAARFTVYDGDGIRLGHQPASSFLDETVALMATFSVRDGLRLFVDDHSAPVAEDATDKRALTAGYEAGQWSILRDFQGQAGVTGLYSVDLGPPEMAHYRRSIFNGLNNRHGLGLTI